MTFKDVHPREALKIHDIYCSSWYGSNIWDLSAKYMDRIYNSDRSTARINGIIILFWYVIYP